MASVPGHLPLISLDVRAVAPIRLRSDTMGCRVHFVACVLLLGGCYPATWTIAPALSGRVTDSQGRPVPGSTVEVANGEGEVTKVAFSVTTDSQGWFERSEEVYWYLHTLPMTKSPARLLLTAHLGAATSTPREILVEPRVRAFGLGRRAPRVNLGDIVIHVIPHQKAPPE